MSWLEKKVKKAKKSVEKATAKVKGHFSEGGTLDPFSQGLGGVGTGGIESKTMGKAFGHKGRRRLNELSKYAPGRGMDVQLGGDVESVKTYFNPEEPELTPDPQIAEDKRREEARRRNRAMGRAFLMTSRGPSKLGA